MLYDNNIERQHVNCNWRAVPSAERGAEITDMGDARHQITNPRISGHVYDTMCISLSAWQFASVTKHTDNATPKQVGLGNRSARLHPLPSHRHCRLVWKAEVSGSVRQRFQFGHVVEMGYSVERRACASTERVRLRIFGETTALEWGDSGLETRLLRIIVVPPLLF